MINWLQQRKSELLAALVGAYFGFYVAIHQVVVSTVYPLPDTYFDRNPSRLPYSLLDKTSPLYTWIDALFFIHPAAVIAGLMIVQAFARVEPSKSFGTPLALGFAAGWVVLGWPLTFW